MLKNSFVNVGICREYNICIWLTLWGVGGNTKYGIKSSLQLNYLKFICQDFKIYIHNIEIDIKYLEVIIDPQLNFTF